MSKTFLFQAIQFSQTVLIQTIQFSISIFCPHTVKCQNSSILNDSVSRSTVSMSKIVLFQTIQFSISMQFSSIWPIGPFQVQPLRARVDLGVMVICIPQSSTITGTSPSDCLVSYLGHSFSDPSAKMQLVYSTALANRANHLFDSYQRLKKWYLMLLFLTLSIIRYVSRVKWNNPGKAVAPSPTLQSSSYWKGNLQVTLNYGCHLSFFYYTRVSWKVSMMTSYLLSMTFLNNEIQPLQHQRKKCTEHNEGLCWKKNLIRLHSIRVSWSAYEPFSWPS